MQVSHKETVVTRRWALILHLTLAGLILLSILIQGFLITARLQGLSVMAHEAGHVSIHYLKNYSLPHGKLKNEK